MTRQTARHQTTPRRQIDNSDAFDVFMARKAEIDAMLARLQALSDDHFDILPDAVNWGDIGTLGHYAELLRRITDSAFREGEHAE